MPNWCVNDLTISGPEKALCAFFDEALGKGEDGESFLLDFDKFVPQPETITRDLENGLWHDWRVRHWGTKWQPDSFHVECQGLSDRRLVTFDTAWSPPLPVVLAMSAKFPTLEFELRYFEGGEGFNGLFTCEGGEVKEDRVGEYFGDRGG